MHANTGGLVETLLRLPVFRSEWVLYLLLGTSLVSVAVMVERWLFFRRRRMNVAAVFSELSQRLDAGDLEQAARLLEGRDALPAKTVLAGLVEYAKGPESVEDLMAGALGRERNRYERGLNFLATIASNAPYVGLFGTVLGIVRSFRDLSANMAEASGAVMAGIAEALIATAIGLLVAIPALVAFNVFKQKVRHTVTDCQLLARLLLSHLKAMDHVPPR
jgi:biopolymer transport protein ExbB/TolQ